MSAVYRCREPFSFQDGNVPRVITAGMLVTDDDVAYKGREKRFEPVSVAAARFAGVEAATAEPGELRQVSVPRRGRPPKVHDPAPPPAVYPTHSPSAAAATPKEETK